MRWLKALFVNDLAKHSQVLLYMRSLEGTLRMKARASAAPNGHRACARDFVQRGEDLGVTLNIFFDQGVPGLMMTSSPPRPARPGDGRGETAPRPRRWKRPRARPGCGEGTSSSGLLLRREVPSDQPGSVFVCLESWNSLKMKLDHATSLRGSSTSRGCAPFGRGTWLLRGEVIVAHVEGH